MAFPRRWSRRIVVAAEPYRWYLRGNETWFDSKHIAVRHDAHPCGQLLLLDFYAHDFEVRPQMIRGAIEFALGDGWHPALKGKPLYIGFDNVEFVRLPPGGDTCAPTATRPR